MSKKNQFKELEDKLSSAQEQLKRAVADYRNLEKRIQEDGLMIAQYSKSQLVNKILPALDSLDQAVAGAAESEAESGWLKGVMMAIKQLRQALVEEGLVEIDTSGQFNPSLHEAVDVRTGENDKILEVVLRVYILNGKVLRPAKVVVGKSQPEKMSEEATKEIETEEV